MNTPGLICNGVFGCYGPPLEWMVVGISTIIIMALIVWIELSRRAALSEA